MSNENTGIVHDTNGNRLVVNSAGTLVVASGGNVDVQSGATVTIKSGATVLTTKDIGAVGSDSGIAVASENVGTLHRTILTLTSLVIATTDATTSGAQGHSDLYTFPVGNISILGATANLTTVGDGVGITATAAIVGAIGTAAPGVDVTLTGTEANIVPSMAGTLVSSAGVMHGASTTPTAVNGSASAVVAKLNIAAPDAGSTANGTVTVSGTVTILWANSGLSQ